MDYQSTFTWNQFLSWKTPLKQGVTQPAGSFPVSFKLPLNINNILACAFRQRSLLYKGRQVHMVSNVNYPINSCSSKSIFGCSGKKTSKHRTIVRPPGAADCQAIVSVAKMFIDYQIFKQMRQKNAYRVRREARDLCESLTTLIHRGLTETFFMQQPINLHVQVSTGERSSNFWKNAYALESIGGPESVKNIRNQQSLLLILFLGIALFVYQKYSFLNIFSPERTRA